MDWLGRWTLVLDRHVSITVSPDFNSMSDMLLREICDAIYILSAVP